ncbi:hypothetical protein GGQ73_001201 [Rhizobium skierniewicense]|uniref:Uncharacterized protein n=1 Tax=Rhizobium skierniewicense TaxID=984260 RepID=A0A7W6C791_9HYPH|nr:hypothetical protein [Rhizobium skierniewicense]MBB3945268.1 hypothetical protein [Rhizobium skierniewicense]
MSLRERNSEKDRRNRAYRLSCGDLLKKKERERQLFEAEATGEFEKYAIEYLPRSGCWKQNTRRLSKRQPRFMHQASLNLKVRQSCNRVGRAK